MSKTTKGLSPTLFYFSLCNTVALSLLFSYILFYSQTEKRERERERDGERERERETEKKKAETRENHIDR